MDSREIESPDEADYTAAVPLEIDEDTANRADDLLREFAEDAGLETALIVDRSGALVAGISAEAEVTVEVISALVAGASGAMRALVSRLGETGAVESLHLGGNRLVYLKEIVNRFILVAVAEVSQPAGLVRQKAIAIEPRLDALLHEIKPPETAPPAPAPAVRSLRAIARERAALREAGLAAAVVAPLVEAEDEIDVSAIDEDEIHVEEHESVQVEEIVVAEFPEEVPVEESFETLEDLAEEVAIPVEAESLESPAEAFEPDEEVIFDEPEEALFSPFEPAEEEENVVEAETVTESEREREREREAESDGIELPDLSESEPAPEPVPREILEPIDFGEPEIVIESSLPPTTPPSPRITLPVDSPFEAEDDEEEEELAITLSHENEVSVFEVEEEEEVENEPEDDEETEPASLLPDSPPPPASLFEFADDDDDDDDDDFEDFLIEEDSEAFGDPAPATTEPAPAFPEYVARRPTSLFEMAGDEDLEDEFSPFTADEEDELEADEKEGAAPAIFEADDEDEDLLDDAPAHLTPVPPEPEAKTGTSGELEEMIAEEEEEEQIRSAGPFYF